MNNTSLSEKDLENLFNIDSDTLFSNEPSIKVTAKADVSAIETQVSGMEIGKTLTFNADIDGVQQEIEAVKNENGTISYFTEIDGTRTQFELNKNGTITYIVNEVPGTEVDTSEDSCERTVNEVPGETIQTVPDAIGTANFILGSHPTILPPIFQTVYQTLVKILLSTARPTALFSLRPMPTVRFPYLEMKRLWSMNWVRNQLFETASGC
ncbi:MAG: hypothetical protein ACLSFZ_09530 [Frisingicoccus sp.]